MKVYILLLILQKLYLYKNSKICVTLLILLNCLISNKFGKYAFIIYIYIYLNKFK